MGKFVPLDETFAKDKQHSNHPLSLWITSLLVTIFIALPSAQAKAQKYNAAHRAVAALPEVKRLEKSEEQDRRIGIMIRDTPTVQQGYYWVQVGIISAVHYTPVYKFAVYTPKMTIGYINTLTNVVESLVVWRRKKLTKHPINKKSL